MSTKDLTSEEFILVTEKMPVGKVVESIKENPAAKYLVVKLQQGYVAIELWEGPYSLQSRLDELADRIGPNILEMALGDVLEMGQITMEDCAAVLEEGQVVGVKISRLTGKYSDTVYGGPTGGLPSSLFGPRYVFGREGKKGGKGARTCPHCDQSFAYYKVKASKGKVTYTCPNPDCGEELTP
jgi:hypothetical protein